MNDLVKFIEGEPPPRSKEYTLPTAWFGYVVAVLEGRPGQWATIDVPPHNAASYSARLTERAADFGVVVECVVRGGVLFARAEA